MVIMDAGFKTPNSQLPSLDFPYDQGNIKWIGFVSKITTILIG